MNARRRAAEALVCCGLPAARGVCCPLCGRVARAAKVGKTAQAPTSPPPHAAGPAFPKPTRAPAARKHLRPRNPGRAKAAVAEDFGPLGAFVRGLPCCVDACRRGPCDPAHVRSRGAGHHAWVEIDGVRKGNITPLCRTHHDRQGRRGIKTFEREHVLVLRPEIGCAGVPCSTLAEAAEVAGDWFEAGVAGGWIEAAPC